VGVEGVAVANAVSRSNLGAWLLKCNPALWDLAAFLRSGERITSWAVQQNYRAAMMAPGDRVLFWVSGHGRGGLPRGIWGAGEVVAPAEDWVDGEHGSRWISRCSTNRSPPPTCALAAWSTWRCRECRRAPTRPGCRPISSPPSTNCSNPPLPGRLRSIARKPRVYARCTRFTQVATYVKRPEPMYT